jgi:hypothetical protein
MRLKNFVRAEKVTVKFVAKIGELCNASRGENGAKCNSFGAELVIESAMPQTNPVWWIAWPPIGSEGGPLVEVAVNEWKVPSTDLA